MKTITVSVPEPIYREFQECAQRSDRTTAELIPEAMEEYRRCWTGRQGSLRSLSPLDLGRVKQPMSPDADLMAEMLI
jgi:hypothetical protein